MKNFKTEDLSIVESEMDNGDDDEIPIHSNRESINLVIPITENPVHFRKK